jgi:hypothetical protein
MAKPKPETGVNPAVQRVADRVAALDWPAIAAELGAHGCAVIGPLLAHSECDELRAGYADDSKYRKRVVMAQHGFGRGEYKYFGYPLPTLVSELRTALYPPLARIANHWNKTLGVATTFPPQHPAFLRRCHAGGQQQPTPLVLRYETDDFNCLHQDVYGEHVFPLQLAILLSDPAKDFTGGEFVLTEQRPRMQSRAEVAPLAQGYGVVFPVRERPVVGARGAYRVNMRHGVSRLRSGERFTLGIIFHDAKT